MANGQLVVVLEEKPEKGLLPLSMLDILIKAREYGDREPRQGKSPLPTALVRSALTAYAENIELIGEARRIGLSGNGKSTFSEIVRHSLAVAIRFKKFADEKKPAAKATPQAVAARARAKTQKTQPEGVAA